MDVVRRLKGLYWDKAWSLVDGCTKCSPGCLNCWSEGVNSRFSKSDFSEVVFREDRLLVPAKGKKKTVFSLWNDLFHEEVSSQNVSEAFRVMVLLPFHTYIVLTKRPERIRKEILYYRHWYSDTTLLPSFLVDGVNPPWFGTSVSSVEEVGRIDTFLDQVKDFKVKKLLSIEPCLGFFPGSFFKEYGPQFDLIIIGCESGPSRRKPDNSWVYSAVKVCRIENVNLYVKQWDFTGKRVEKLPYGFGAWCSQLPWDETVDVK